MFLALALASCEDTGHDPGPAHDAPPADAAAPARLTLDPTSLQFGTVTVATASPERLVTVINMGQSDSGMISATFTGTDPSQFSVVNRCTYLLRGGTCGVSVTFAPTSAGTKSATLVVAGTPGGTVGTTLAAEGVP